MWPQLSKPNARGGGAVADVCPSPQTRPEAQNRSRRFGWGQTPPLPCLAIGRSARFGVSPASPSCEPSWHQAPRLGPRAPDRTFKHHHEDSLAAGLDRGEQCWGEGGAKGPDTKKNITRQARSCFGGSPFYPGKPGHVGAFKSRVLLGTHGCL